MYDKLDPASLKKLEENFRRNLGQRAARRTFAHFDGDLDGGKISAEQALNDLREYLYGWEHGKYLCESPIELLFFVELISFPHVFCRNVFTDECAREELFRVVVDLQAPVGDYRLDFLLTVETARGLSLLAVECDGHDFHERTKEQAARDRSRDRDLLARGIRVMRFTGSEIHACAWKCAGQVWMMAYRIAHEHYGIEEQS